MSRFGKPEVPGIFQCGNCYEGVHVTDDPDADTTGNEVSTADADATCPMCGAAYADGWADALGEKVAHVQLTSAAGDEDMGALVVGLTENQQSGAFGVEWDGDHASVYKKRIPTADD